MVDEPPRDERTGRAAAAQRMERKAEWVDAQLREAMRRGDFDNLPGAGKPLDLPAEHDPDWWLRKLIEREQITGVLPAALMLRKEDLELEAEIDREPTEEAVRRLVEEFNRRVVEARRQLTGGPPVITKTRDVDAEVEGWRSRRTERRRAREQAAAVTDPPSRRPRRRRWFGR